MEVPALQTSLPLQRVAGGVRHHQASRRRRRAVARLISEGVTSEIPMGADETNIDAALRAAQPALFMLRWHALHLPGSAGRGPGGDERQPRAGAGGSGGRVRADLPVAPADRAPAYRL